MGRVLMHSKWSQIMKYFSTRSTLVVSLSRSTFMDLLFLSFQIRLLLKFVVALATLVLFLVGMGLFVVF